MRITDDEERKTKCHMGCTLIVYGGGMLQVDFVDGKHGSLSPMTVEEMNIYGDG